MADDVLITERRNRLSHYLGSGWDYSILDAGRQLDVENIRKSGDRQVYWPPTLPGEGAPHRWSWLRAMGTISLWDSVAVTAGVTATGVYDGSTYTVITANTASFYETMVGKSIVVTDSGTYEIAVYVSSTVIKISGDHAFAAKTFGIEADGNYDLPTDLESLETDLTFTDRRGDIQLVGEHVIRQLRGGTDPTGMPRYAATRAKSATGTAAQKLELCTHPIANEVYSVRYRYRRRPDATQTYAMGGAELGELFIASDAAAAEERKWGRKGDAWAHFMTVLASRVQADRLAHGSPTLGRMRDGYGDESMQDRWHANTGDFTVNYINTAP